MRQKPHLILLQGLGLGSAGYRFGLNGRMITSHFMRLVWPCPRDKVAGGAELKESLTR